MAQRGIRDWRCTFYKDARATEIINLANIGEVWAGTEKSLVIFYKNREKGKVREIVYSTGNPKVTLVGPVELDPDEVGSISIRWSPDFDAEEGLIEDIVIEGTLVL